MATMRRRRPLFDQALPRLEKVGYQGGIAESRLYRARLDYALGDSESVERLLNAAIDQFERDEAWDYLAECTSTAPVEVAQQRGEFAQALTHFRSKDAGA